MEMFDEDFIHTAPDGSVSITGKEALKALSYYSHVNFEKTEKELPEGVTLQTPGVLPQIMGTCIIRARISDENAAQLEAMRLLDNPYFREIVQTLFEAYEVVVKITGSFPCVLGDN